MSNLDNHASREAQQDNNDDTNTKCHEVGLQGMDLYGSDNYQEAIRFLETLYGRCSDDLLAVITHAIQTEQAYGFGDDREVVVESGRYSESRSIAGPEELAARACQLGLGTDVWIRVCPVAERIEGKARGKAKDSVALPALYIDLDVGKENAPATREDALALLAELVPVPPTMLVNSGNGLHCYFVLAEPITDFEQMRQVMRCWKTWIQGEAKERGFKIDSAFDLARVLRVPGTLNFKAEPLPVELPECHPDRLYSVDDLLPDGWDDPNAEQKRADETGAAEEHSLAEDIATIIDVLPRIPDHHIDEYQTWLEIGMAIHSVLPDDAGLALWRERSMVSAKYEEGCCEEKWRTFEHKPNGVGIGTLVHLAQEAEAQHLKIGGSGIRAVSREAAPATTSPDAVQKADEGTAVVRPKTPPVLFVSNPMRSARIFVEHEFSHGDFVTLYSCGDQFSAWKGTHYEPLSDKEVKARIWLLADRAHGTSRGKNKDGNEKARSFAPNTKAVNNIFNACQALVTIPATTRQPCWLDPEPGAPDPQQIVALSNCLFDLESGMLLPHTPRFFSPNATDYAYDPNAGEPVKWLKFLRQLWPNDPDAIRALQQWFGYCLTQSTAMQKILLMVGPKRSGKGTIGRVLTGLLGQNNVAGPTLAGLNTNFGLSALIGKPLAIIADARISGRADQAAIAERLLSISGEDGLTVDRKYKEAWTGKLPTRFMIMTNELPRLADASGALASRFVVLTLQNSFYGKENRELTRELVDELPAIFNWAVDGWRDLQATGAFVQPASSQEAIDDLESLGSPITAFIKECCKVGPQYQMPVRSLYGAWRNWWRNNGRDFTGDIHSFGRQLKAAVPGLTTTQETNAGVRERIYKGIMADDPGFGPV